MKKYLFEGSLLLCPHGGSIQLVGTGDRSVHVSGLPILTKLSLERVIIACPVRLKPCTKILPPMDGVSKVVKVNGSEPLLENLRANTENGPIQVIPVQQWGGEGPVEGLTTTRKEGEGKAWIEIELVDEDERPVRRKRYRVKTPSGQSVEGYLDGRGKARICGIESGSCEVSFPELDADAWGPA